MTTLESRYEGGWQNVQPQCMLCKMEKRTEWYIETPHFVVAEKLGGGPFVVSKRHQTELSDEDWEVARHTVSLVFGEDFELVVRMNLVEDHWHAHIVTDETPSLDGE